MLYAEIAEIAEIRLGGAGRETSSTHATKNRIAPIAAVISSSSAVAFVHACTLHPMVTE